MVEIMAKKTVDVCVYCGQQAELTREHVVPQCLFPKPLPSNMVTVGTCTTHKSLK
jgi:hypothetical protein